MSESNHMLREKLSTEPPYPHAKPTLAADVPIGFFAQKRLNAQKTPPPNKYLSFL